MVPLRVVIIIDTAVIGGPGRGLLQLWRFHDRDQFQLQFVVFRRAGGASTEFIEALRAVGAPVHIIEQRSRYDLRGVREFEDLIRSGKGRLLVQSHNYKSHILAWWLARRFGLPWVAFAHGWTAENFRARSYHLLDRVLLVSADAVVAVSPPLYDRISSWRKGRGMHCIENAIDAGDWSTAAPQAQSSRDGGDIICVGRLSAEKGQRVLLHAWAELCARGRVGSARLKLVGDGPDRTELGDLAVQLRIADRVVFAGYTSNVAEHYRSAAILVIPSLSEGLPNVLLEALLQQIPVVATAVGAIPSMHQDGESFMLVPPGDPTALAGAIELLLGDKELRQSLCARGSELIARRFAPKPRVEKIQAIYRDIVAKSKQD